MTKVNLTVYFGPEPYTRGNTLQISADQSPQKASQTILQATRDLQAKRVVTVGIYEEILELVTAGLPRDCDLVVHGGRRLRQTT